jgi:ribitol-5-phosphate 2-dehydrogenase
MGATADGMARTFFLYPEKGVVELPAGTKLEAAALVEPASIALNAVEEAGVKPGARGVVIGDGAMGYLVALMLSHVAKIPKQNLFLVGISDKKLALAEDFAQTINSLTEEKKLAGLRQKVDVVFEAVGGKAQEKTVAEAIALLRPGGKAIVLGLSKDRVPIKLVDLVNRGLELKGSTRSGEGHYKRMVLFLEDEGFQERLGRFACEKRFKIEGVEDLKRAFEFADSEKSGNGDCNGRVMVEFE